jgi:hypothetical protein
MTEASFAAADSGALQSRYAARDVRLDANPASAFWRAATPVYAEVDSYGKPIPHYRTEVRSRWTKGNLYLLFICPYEDLYLKPDPSTTAETNKLWNWDVAELFIGNDWKNIRRYKEFEMSPQGEWVDLDINLDLPDHTVGWLWNSGFEVTAHIDAARKVWYGAMRIPFAAIDTAPPEAGRAYRANLYRGQGPPDRHQSVAWKPPMRETFHTPECFGKLVLTK